MSFSNHNAIPTDQVTVLLAVVARIRDQVPLLSQENNCFLSMSMDPIGEQRQDIYATVAPMSGRFDHEMFVGAGDAGACEQTGVIITVFSQMRLDRPSQDLQMLTQESRGLLLLKKQILKALAGHDLQDSSGNRILRDRIEPLNASHPQRYDESEGTFSLSFATNFVWDLS